MRFSFHASFRLPGREDVSVLYRTPRCSIVLLRRGAMRVMLISAHAPHSKIAACRAYWHDVVARIRGFLPDGFQIVTCSDVNRVIALTHAGQ